MPLHIACRRTTDALVAQLAAGRDLTATWLVVDMDAFFASVEELHDPSLVHILFCETTFADKRLTLSSSARFIQLFHELEDDTQSSH